MAAKNGAPQDAARRESEAGGSYGVAAEAEAEPPASAPSLEAEPETDTAAEVFAPAGAAGAAGTGAAGKAGSAATSTGAGRAAGSAAVSAEPSAEASPEASAEASGRTTMRVFQFVPGERCRQEPLTSKCQRHAAGIASDPAPPPLLGNIRRRPAAASGIDNEVAGIGGHEKAAFDNCRQCLNYVKFIGGKSACLSVSPKIREWRYGVIAQVVHKAKGIPNCKEPVSLC